MHWEMTMFRSILAAVLLTLSGAAFADDGGTLNPTEGGILHLKSALKQRPERAGFLCWVVYEVQKGGHDMADTAFEALNDCAESGNAPSMIMLAHAHENGQGTEINPERSTYWVRRAAESGYSMGQYHLGVALITGFGTTVNKVEGRTWLQKAAAGGNKDAEDYLRKMNW